MTMTMKPRGTQFDAYEFNISTRFACAIINGDYSGLDDDDERKLDAFLAGDLFVSTGHWDVNSDDLDDPDFRLCEVCDLLASTATFTYYKQIEG